MHSNLPPIASDWLLFGTFQISATRRELWQDGKLIGVGERSLDLLLALLVHPGEPVSKERLTQAAWGERAVESSNLTVQITALRGLLADPGGNASNLHQIIRTVPGYGYVFAAPLAGEPTEGTAEQSLVNAGPDGSAETNKPNQPAEPLTLFIGRESERRILERLLTENRLVCLAGIGGVGKTRLALRLGRDLVSAYDDGVTFVDLAPLLDPGQVAEAVAVAVGAGDGWNSVQDALVAALRARRLLLILDNAEHLTAGVRQLIEVVIARCPDVAVLVTSRESLGFPGEVVFRLLPLELPPDSADISVTDALRYDAVRLFLDRARALLPGFDVDADNVGHVVEICRRLDGIALAIEMAVPRLDVLTLRQLADRLHDRFRAVAPLRHSVVARQRTLQAMFDWSWELLSLQEQRLLQMLAIFVGGATLSSLEEFAASNDVADPVAAVDVIGQLTTLAQKSLIVIGIPGPDRKAGPRYRLLETTRQYALDHLDLGQRQMLTRLHARHIAATFERAETEWPTTHGTTWLNRYGPETDNLRAAMQWAFSRDAESELGLQLVAASFSLWWELPGLPLRERRDWFALAMERIGPSTPVKIQARIWLGQSWTDTLDGDLDNYPVADRAIQLFREAGDQIGLGTALWRAAGTVLGRDHDPSGEVLLDAAINSFKGQPATKWQALCHVRQADLLQQGGALLPALVEYDRALTIMRDTGYHYGLMVCGSNRSYLLCQLGCHDAAITALRSLRRDLPVGLSFPLVSVLAMVLTAAGHDAEARSAVRESLTGTLSVGMLATLARSIEAQALLSANLGDIQTAARLLGFVLTLHPPDHIRFGPRKVVYDRLRILLAAALTPTEKLRFMAEGAAWTETGAAEAAVRACDQFT